VFWICEIVDGSDFGHPTIGSLKVDISDRKSAGSMRTRDFNEW